MGRKEPLDGAAVAVALEGTRDLLKEFRGYFQRRGINPEKVNFNDRSVRGFMFYHTNEALTLTYLMGVQRGKHGGNGDGKKYHPRRL